MRFVAMKCRHPGIRRQALATLQRAPLREGLWDREVAVAIAKRVIELEESLAGSSSPFSCTAESSTEPSGAWVGRSFNFRDGRSATAASTDQQHRQSDAAKVVDGEAVGKRTTVQWQEQRSRVQTQPQCTTAYEEARSAAGAFPSSYTWRVDDLPHHHNGSHVVPRRPEQPSLLSSSERDYHVLQSVPERHLNVASMPTGYPLYDVSSNQPEDLSSRGFPEAERQTTTNKGTLHLLPSWSGPRIRIGASLADLGLGLFCGEGEVRGTEKGAGSEAIIDHGSLGDNANDPVTNTLRTIRVTFRARLWGWKGPWHTWTDDVVIDS
jgi:hypothetical protein